MKNQLAQMMESIKQKESLIMQNNQKLTQQPINNLENNGQMNINNPQINQYNPQQQNQFNNNALNYNTLNNINQLGGLNAYMQYTGTNPFAMQQPNNIVKNNFNNNQMGFNNQFMNNNNNNIKNMSGGVSSVL